MAEGSIIKEFTDFSGGINIIQFYTMFYFSSFCFQIVAFKIPQMSSEYLTKYKEL